MARLEDRILGEDPRAKAAGKFDNSKLKIVPEDPNDEWVRNLPSVLGINRSVRYEPFTGILHLESFQTKPETPEISYRRWSRHTSLESVTGAAAEIVGKYGDGGDIVRNTLGLYEFVNDKLWQFGDNAITDAQLGQLHQDVVERLFDFGFATAQKPIKVEIAKQVRGGINFDSIDRRNPLISRARLASSMMKLLIEQRFENEVLQKYYDIFFRLLGEQQLEEAYVETILEELTNGNFTPEVLKKAWQKHTVKAAPYRLPVMQAYIIQFDATDFATAKYFEDDELRLETLNDPGISLDERRGMVIDNLKTALEDGESIYSV